MGSEQLSAAKQTVANRYRVDAILGRGGMGVVSRAHDLARDRPVALKRVLEGELSHEHIARMFELEYHTLSQLAHPRVIEVYDYQSDEQGPFYTMELLTGGDLRQLAPLGWRDVCRVLCDVCSALALLHSRRLVHRDLTPQNVRCTEDGRAKLFDFGSMTQFGRAKHVVGTPPFIAPETLNGQMLDGQVDLYALGATAYFALTGRHAFPAPTIAELPGFWRKLPAAPSQFVPDVPPALDELVLALLRESPSARPASASEVMERLSAIGGFEVQEALLVSHSYLSTPTLVGREQSLATFSEHQQRLRDGHGAVIRVHGAPGCGRSRFLDACALQAKLSGSLVLRTDARASATGRWGAARALLEHMMQELPDLGPKLLAAHESVLAPVWAASSATESTVDVSRAQAGRAEVQAALRELLHSVARHRPLVLVVDDLDRLDEPSAALFALLAHRVAEHPMLLIGSAVTADSVRTDQRALRLFASLADEIRLLNLDAQQCEQLIVASFGEVLNVRWLADRIFEATHGNPAQVIQVARHLVQRGVCNYAAGTWTLPSRLDSNVLASALQHSIDPDLPKSALALARVIALTDLARVTLDQCLQLSGHRDLKQLQVDLNALAAEGIANVDEGEVSLNGRGWVPGLLRGLDAAQKQALHLQVAELFAQRSPNDFRRIQHLLWAGEAERALDLQLALMYRQRSVLIRDQTTSFEYLQSLPRNWAETYHGLIDAAREAERPLRDRLMLQVELLAFTTLSARYEGAHMLEVAAQLTHDVGLDLIAELRERVPPDDLLGIALQAAQRRYEATPEHQRGLPLQEALPCLAQLTIQAIGMAGRTFDMGLLESMPSLAPLVPLSPALAVVQKNLESTLAVLSGNSEPARRAYLEIAQRVSEPDGAGLEGSHRFHMHAAALWAAGMIEVNLARPAALERAAAIEHNPLFAVSALRLRAMYALVRGERAQAEDYLSQTELLQIQNCPPQLFEGTQAMQATFGFAAIGELLRVKQCLVDVEVMAQQHVGWKPIVYCGRGAYQMLRGDYVQARVELEAGLELMPVGHLAWSFCAGALVSTLLRSGLNEAAVTRGRELLAQFQAEEIQALTIHHLLIALALAESSVGRHSEGLAHIQAASAALSAEGGAGVWLGEAHEVRARIALNMGDATAFEHSAAECYRQYRIGGHPFLLARYEKLLNASSAHKTLSPSDHEPQPDPVLLDETVDTTTEQR